MMTALVLGSAIMTEFCCEKFAEQAKPQIPTSAGHIPQFVCDDGWHINGCCGGGCYVVTEMKFCPYCGTKLDSAHHP